jgi:hypothetical protein
VQADGKTIAQKTAAGFPEEGHVLALLRGL